ncbi:hypothetical protein BGZ83_006031 [Gryganskiella cystojenkinii]|nr:hypothetical protein BGZ83_006031 [Gryganskiella cystojenkinii]
MFNSGFNAGGFGGQQQQSAGFGTGQNTFGSTSSFGAPAGGGFGAAGNTGFGGANQTAGFGAAPTTSAFGAAPATSGFGGGGFGGSSTGFGAQAQPQTGFGGSTFGATSTPASTGGFGGFGSSSTAPGGFGSGSAFGAKPTTTGFGAQPTGFGQNTSTGFGGTTSAFGGGGGMLGGSAMGGTSQGTGTVNPAFAPYIETETSTGQKSHYQSITAMPAYRGYSFEELRLQDYQQGRKFPGQAGGFGATGGFGAQQQQPAASGFGAQPATGFGAQPSTLGGFGSGSTGFGNTAATGFGSGAGFGQTTTAATGFGAQATAPTTGFGSATSAFGAPTTTGFGSTATTGGFGSGGGFGANATKPATGFGGFGTTATSQPSSGFGGATGAFGAAPASTGLFGAPSAAGTTSAFGAPAAGATTAFGGFGAPAASAAPASTGLGFGSLGGGAFGAAKPATTSLFGAPATSTAAPTFSGFGSAPAASGAGSGLFGGATGSSSLFPASSAGSTGLFGGGGATAAPAFGTSTASTGLFGAAKPATAGGLFGGAGTSTFGAAPSFGAAAPTTSLFGAGGATGGPFGASTTGTGLFGGVAANTAAAQPAMVASINGNIYGDNPLFQRDSTAPASKSQPAVLSRTEPAQKLPAHIPPVRFSPRHSQIRLRPASTATFSSSVSSAGDLSVGRKTLLLLDGINDDSAFSSDEYAPRRSVKKLELKPRGQDAGDHQQVPNGTSSHGVTFNSALESTAAESIFRGRSTSDRPSLGAPSNTADFKSSGFGSQTTAASRLETPSHSVVTQSDKVQGEYWMEPSLEELRKMTRSELQSVRNFRVGLPEYGSVDFLEPVDLTTVPSLSSICGHIVVFSHKVCKVYPDEHNKPPRGQGMNVPAIISLDRCWPLDKRTREPIKFDKSNPLYAQHLKRLKRQSETTFMDFVTEKGTWTFRVEHFSEYGLSDDDDCGNVDDEAAHVNTTGRRTLVNAAEQTSSSFRSAPAVMSTATRDNRTQGLADPDINRTESPELPRSTASFPRNHDPQRLNMMRTSIFSGVEKEQRRQSKRSNVWSSLSDHAEQADSRTEHADGFEAEGNLLADAGLMMGRSCRVGWGPNGMLAICGTLHEFDDVKERPTGEKNDAVTHNVSLSCVQLIKVPVVFGSQQEETKRHIVSLQAQLQNTTVTLDQYGRPKANIIAGTSFTAMMASLKSLDHNLSTEEVNAWILGQALFDTQPVPSDILALSEAARESYETIGRRVRCSNWLAHVTKPLLEADLRLIAASGKQEDAVFPLLVSNKRQKATVASVQSGNPRLATLLSQSCRGSRPLTGVLEQLRLSMTGGAENMPTYYRKVYALLGGALTMNVASRGQPPQTVSEGLDWKRTFGLYLWFSDTPGTNLQEAVDSYVLAMTKSKSIARPSPWYQKSTNPSGLEPAHFDFLFQLMSLLTKPSMSLEAALHPLGMGPSPFDSRQSWLFYQVLVQSLHLGGFRSGSSHAKLCHDFMFQLECLGLWEWAVFVALHLEGADSRERSIRQLLERHVDLPARDSHVSDRLSSEDWIRWTNESEKGSFVIKTLCVPEKWLWVARATRAKYNGDLSLEVFSLLKGGEHQKGLGLILSSLAPTFILQDDLVTLGSLLAMVDQSRVTKWSSGGAIYQKYLDCCSDSEGKVGRVRFGSKVSYANDLVPQQDLKDLETEASLLLQQLPTLLEYKVDPSTTLIDVAVTEMASRCTRLLRDLKEMSVDDSTTWSDLPLTEDQRVSTVQKISSNYFDQLLSFAETSAH